MSDEKKWGWCYLDADVAQGPFDSRDEAIADAMEHTYPDGRDTEGVPAEVQIDVGTCGYADPADYVDDDFENFIDRMDTNALDNEYAFHDGPVFDLKNGFETEKVRAEYKKMVTEFAAKHFESSVWVMESVVRVLLSKEGWHAVRPA